MGLGLWGQQMGWHPSFPGYWLQDLGQVTLLLWSCFFLPWTLGFCFLPHEERDCTDYQEVS